MKTFYYTRNHKADEAYMAEMCHVGWAATRLVEGVWTFAPCEPDQYTFRECCLRGKSHAEVEARKYELAAEGIEFVSRYAFRAIFRSEHDFRLYTPEEELALCETIRRPMLVGSVLSWIVFAALLVLAVQVSAWFCILTVLVGVYAAMCIILGRSYAGLLRTLRGEREAPAR